VEQHAREGPCTLRFLPAWLPPRSPWRQEPRIFHGKSYAVRFREPRCAFGSRRRQEPMWATHPRFFHVPLQSSLNYLGTAQLVSAVMISTHRAAVTCWALSLCRRDHPISAACRGLLRSFVFHHLQIIAAGQPVFGTRTQFPRREAAVLPGMACLMVCGADRDRKIHRGRAAIRP